MTQLTTEAQTTPPPPLTPLPPTHTHKHIHASTPTIIYILFVRYTHSNIYTHTHTHTNTHTHIQKQTHTIPCTHTHTHTHTHTNTHTPPSNPPLHLRTQHTSWRNISDTLFWGMTVVKRRFSGGVSGSPSLSSRVISPFSTFTTSTTLVCNHSMTYNQIWKQR